MLRLPPISVLYPFTTFFLSKSFQPHLQRFLEGGGILRQFAKRDRKSTRLNSSHLGISYAVFCLKKRILDLGGGSGAYSIAFAQACPDVKCEILDLPEVVPLTEEYIGRAGVSAQVGIRAGDMLHDDFGSGYDIVMLNAICHMFSEEQNQEIFRCAHQALAPNGRLVVDRKSTRLNSSHL